MNIDKNLYKSIGKQLKIARERKGTFVDNEVIETITLPKDLFKGSTGTLFGQYAEGDSMVGVGINDGDLIIFEETNLIENGQIGCFCIDHNIATCKDDTRYVFKLMYSISVK